MPKKYKKSGIAPTEIEALLALIKNAEKTREDADLKFQYSKCLKLYEGDFGSVIPTWMQGIELIPINEPYAFAKTFIPSVYSRDPYLTVIPKGRKYIIGAKVLELAVNSYWRKLKLKRQIRMVVFDAIFAEGWMKVGYSSSLGKVEKENGEKSVFPSEFIQKDEIFAQRISWKNIVRDPDAVDGIRDARFVAQKIILPLEAVQAASYYENTEDLKPNYVMEVKVPGYFKGSSEYTAQTNYVSLWECWNIDEQKVYTIAEGHDAYLMNKKWPYDLHGYPFERMVFNETFDQPYAPNLIAPWLPQLWEKMKIRSMELDHLKRFGRQYVIEKGAMDRQNKDKLKKGYTGSVLEVEPGKSGPQPIAYPPIQTDIYAVENRIDMDKDNISGQPNAVRSAPQKTTSRTLGEVDRLISAFQSRQNDPQGVIEEFSENVATKLINLMQQYFNAEEYIKASALDVQFLQREAKDNPLSDRLDDKGFLMRREDIKDIDFEVEARSGSTLPLDKKNRTQAMVSIIELGERVGIAQGDKVSRVIGKNLMAEFEMPEIIQAYEDNLRKLEAAETARSVGQIAQAALTRRQVERAQGRVNNMAPQAQSQPRPTDGVPAELLE